MKMRLMTLALASALAFGAVDTQARGPASSAPIVAGAAASATTAPDPAAHVEQLVRLFRAGDVAALARASVPPSKWAQIQAAWEVQRHEPISDADRVKFQEKLAKVTAPDAVDQLMAEIEPKLEQARPQLPGALLMGFGAMHMAVTSEDSDLTPEQREALRGLIPGVQSWAASTDFLSSTTMRDALTLLTDAVRRAGVQNLDQLKTLPLDELLRRAGPVLTAAKDAAGLYGLDLDAVADSLRVDVLENTGDTARIRATVTVFGAPIFGETELVLVEGQWYGKHTAVQWDVDTDADDDSADDEAVES